MKRRKLSLRLISLLLCFVMLGLSSPIVIAEEAEIQTQETQPPSSKDGATSTNELQEPEQTEAATESLVASTSSSTQILDGVYKISDSASGLYLEVIGDSTASGTGLQLWGARTGADEARQLFAIEQIGSDGMFEYYTLRPQVNPSLGLTIGMGGGPVTVSTLSDDPLGDEAYDQLIVLNGTMNSCQIQGGGEVLKSSLCVTSTVTAGATVSASDNPSLVRSFCLVPQTVITSGVYRIKNVANNNYLNLPYTTNQTLGTLNVTSFTDSEAFMRNQLFKVSFVENIDGTNYYTIRSMVDNSVGLWLEYLMVNTTTLATTDDSLGEYGISIVATEGGYLIQGGMSDLKANLAAPATFANGNAVFASGDATATTSKWIFEKYVMPLHGITWKTFYPKVVTNRSVTYQASLYTSTIGFNGPITYTVSNQDGTTTNKASIGSSTGTLTGATGGIIHVTAHLGSFFEQSEEVEILFEEGIAYSISSLSYGGLISPTLNSTTVILEDLNENQTKQLWQFESVGNGYYRIRNDFSGKYLCCTSNNASSVVAHEFYPTNGTAEQINGYLWRFWTTTNGSARIQNKRFENTAYYLTYTINNNFAMLVHSNTGSDNYWQIEPLMLVVEVLHDQALRSRFSTVGYQTMLENVFGKNKYGKSFAGFFKEHFGIRVKITYSSEIHNTSPVYTEDCEYENDIDELCLDCKDYGRSTPAWECKDLHHKRELEFLYSLPLQQMKESIRIKMLFTGHVACHAWDPDDNGPLADVHGSYAAGWAIKFLKAPDNIILPGANNSALYTAWYNYLNTTTYVQENYNHIIRVTIHETIHNFNTNHCENSCIMNNGASEAETENLTICTTCITNVQNNKMWLYYHGK